MTTLIGNIGKNADPKRKWNAAIRSIKRELHSLEGGLNVSSLNTVYSLYVNAYNRCIVLLEELDRKYGSFIPPDQTYYDELDTGKLINQDNFTAELSLVLTKIDKLPKFNPPILKLQHSTETLSNDWRAFERSYVTKANKSVSKSNTVIRDRSDHLGALQSYINKMAQYATQEQLDKALEEEMAVLGDVIVQVSTENAESLGEVIGSLEEAKENNAQVQTSGSAEVDIGGVYGDPSDTSSMTEEEIDRNIQDFRDAEAAAKAAAEAAEAERQRLNREAQEAQQNLNEARNRVTETLQASQEADNAAVDRGLNVDSYTSAGGGKTYTTVDTSGRVYNYEEETGTMSVTDTSTGMVTSYTQDANGKWTTDTGFQPTDPTFTGNMDAIKDVAETSEAYIDAVSDLDTARRENAAAQAAASTADTTGPTGTNSELSGTDREGGWTSDDFNADDWGDFW